MQDVLIIGGGPAGSTAASLLAIHGHRVKLLEQTKFPREHVGESLLPFCYEIFESLGVLDEMKSLFVRKPTVRFLSNDGSRSTNWCFNEVIKDESSLSFHVDRKIFDTVLLNNSRHVGVDVHEETKVTDVSFDTDNDCVLVTSRGKDNRLETHKSRFLIDASGRSTFMASTNGWRTADQTFARTALWTHWSHVKNMDGGLNEGSALIVYLGGEKRGWIWIFPLGRDRVTAGVVMETSYLREQKRRLVEGGSSEWTLDLYQEELNESPFVRGIIDGAEMVRSVRVEGDYSYNTSIKHGRRYALVGDASRFVDPIFSSGVYLSIKSASLVADSLDKMLKSGDLDANEPLIEAYQQINGAYDFIYRLIALFYDPHSVSFADAGTALREHTSHEDAMAAGHYILSGDFFVNHRRYHKFLDLLADSRRFEMHKQLVVQRHASDKDSCNLSAEERAKIFPAESESFSPPHHKN